MAGVRLGVALEAQATDWAGLLAAARLVDRCGYVTLWLPDLPGQEPGVAERSTFDAWVALSALASATERVGIGHLALANTFRNPAIVARMVSTLDHVSGGRATLGLGAGRTSRAHAAYGIAFGGSAGKRLEWLDEAAGLVRRLLDGETVTHNGPRYQTKRLALQPRPLQERLPLLIGGRERRALPIVARHADIWHAGVLRSIDEHIHLAETLSRHCVVHGRSPAEVEWMTSLPPLVIRDDPEEARRVRPATARGRHSEAAGHPSDDGWFGPPELIAERLQPLVEIGFRHLIVALPEPYDRETIERLIGEALPLLNRIVEASPHSEVAIIDYDPAWVATFEEQRAEIAAALARATPESALIEHVGSTSVPGLAAKPIIDMMVAYDRLPSITRIAPPLEAIGYEHVAKPEFTESYFFRRGDRDEGTHHLHVTTVDSDFGVQMLRFRDALRASPELAADYAAFKRRLAARYPHDRPSYTRAKGPYVTSILETGGRPADGGER